MQIYVACLASYNAGILHGEWIDLDGMDADDLRGRIADMLRRSPCPNVTVECPRCEGTGRVHPDDPSMAGLIQCGECGGALTVPSAEEWAVHDYDGLPDMGEHPNLDKLCELAGELERADEDGNREAFELWADNVGGGTYQDFLDQYAGTFNTRAEFAMDYVENAGLLDGVPESIAYYFDYDSLGRDMLLSDAYEIDGHYFWNR